MVDTISILCSAMQSSDSLSVASGNGSLQSRHAVSGSRKQLDKIFLLDASLSITFGIISLLSPHRFISALNGGSYNHSAHEALRLYSCLRIAVGWILFHIRYVDDGKFRRSICEALCLCYIFQACVVIRAQLTDSNWINWVALLFLFSIGGLYGRFRFGMGGGLIKVYELPLSSRSEL